MPFAHLGNSNFVKSIEKNEDLLVAITNEHSTVDKYTLHPFCHLLA